MKSPEELQAIITRKINGFCEKNGDASIYQPVNYIMKLGGKRVRPMLALMSANLFCEEIEDAIYPAIAMEVFHNFTLMHDDIMDNAPLRRGQATVHEKWNRDVAILSGDAMLIQSYQLLMQTRTDVLTDVLRVFNTTALGVCEGQHLDMDFEKRKDVNIADYLEMIRLKTSILLAGALKIGAIVSGAPAADQQHIYSFGENIGLAFQLWDDYLDAFGDEKKTGKKRGGDILAGKKTFLILRAYEKAEKKELEILDRYSIETVDDKEKVETTLGIITKLGVQEELKVIAESYHIRAMNHLDAIDVPKERKHYLSALITQMMNRES
jgi:geranylgeranyl diphosphate synthase, type II